MERDTDSVGACRCDELYVCTGYIVVLEHFPEFGREIWSDKFAEHVVDHSGRVGLAETEHVSFRIEPVSEVGSLDEESASVRGDDVRSLDVHESFLRELSLSV